MLPDWLRLETDLKALSFLAEAEKARFRCLCTGCRSPLWSNQLQSGSEIGEIARQHQPGENKRKIPRAVAFKFARWCAIAL